MVDDVLDPDRRVAERLGEKGRAQHQPVQLVEAEPAEVQLVRAVHDPVPDPGLVQDGGVCEPDPVVEPDLVTQIIIGLVPPRLLWTGMDAFYSPYVRRMIRSASPGSRVPAQQSKRSRSVA